MQTTKKRKGIKFIDWHCFLTINDYANGGIRLDLRDLDDGSPVATATTWVPGLAASEVAIKNYAENEGMLSILQKHGIVGEVKNWMPSGYMSFPVCTINMKEAAKYTLSAITAVGDTEEEME